MFDSSHPGHTHSYKRKQAGSASAVYKTTSEAVYAPETLQLLRLEPRLEPYHPHNLSVQSGLRSGICRPWWWRWRWHRRHGYGRRHVNGQPAPACILALRGSRGGGQWRLGCMCAHVGNKERVIAHAGRLCLVFCAWRASGCGHRGVRGD